MFIISIIHNKKETGRFALLVIRVDSGPEAG